MSNDRTDRRAEIYISRKPEWQNELNALRHILLDCGLTETFKWRGPVYMWKGANLAALGRMKACAVLSFFRGVLLDDPDGLLQAPGKNSRSSRVVRFTDCARVAQAETTLRALIAQAIHAEDQGLKVNLPKDDLPDYPEELIARFDQDAPLRLAFGALTPGRRRGWLLHFSQAKQSATRTTRIARAVPHILAGKGMHDR